MRSGSLWNYYRDEINDSAIEIINDGNNDGNNKTTTSKSFEYETKIIGYTSNNDNNVLDAEFVILLNYLSNFWRSLDLPLIYGEIKLGLRWKNIV